VVLFLCTRVNLPLRRNLPKLRVIHCPTGTAQTLRITFNCPHRRACSCPLLVGCEVPPGVSIGGYEQTAGVVEQTQRRILDLHAGHKSTSNAHRQIMDWKLPVQLELFKGMAGPTALPTELQAQAVLAGDQGDLTDSDRLTCNSRVQGPSHTPLFPLMPHAQRSRPQPSTHILTL
jgi:hypothetical protein